MSEYKSKEDISRVLLERIGANESCLSRAREKGLHESEQYFNNLLFEDGQITSLIEGLPSADVRENIHGHWIATSECDTCSECHFKVVAGFNFCPNCGADMSGKEVSK